MPTLNGLIDFVAQLSPVNPERLTRPSEQPSTLAATASAVSTTAAATLAGASKFVEVLLGSKEQLQPNDGTISAITAAAAAGNTVLSAAFVKSAATKARVETEGLLRLPYTLLRRGPGYDVRRYSSDIVAASTEGSSTEECPSSVLANYLGGANTKSAIVSGFTPYLVGASQDTIHERFWLAVPVGSGSNTDAGITFPGSTQGVSVGPLSMLEEPSSQGMVVAVRRLPREIGSVKPVIKTFSRPSFDAERERLLNSLAGDGLAPGGGAFLASYRPLRSPPPPLEEEGENRAADEIWVPLAGHDWLR